MIFTDGGMDSRQLDVLMSRLTGSSFCGVWASDQLASLTSLAFKTPAYFIVNTHPAHEPGEHWLALTLDEDGTGTFFDSFGFPPNFYHYPRDILNFLKPRCSAVLHHNRQLQHTLSSACGHHCVYYLCHRAWGLSFDNVLSLYQEDELKNDETVIRFVKKFQNNTWSCKPRSCNHSACSLQMFKQCYNLREIKDD